MRVSDLDRMLPEDIIKVTAAEGIDELRPSQQKAIDAGVLDFKSVLVCTPTASGKTLIAEMAGAKSIIENRGKVVYVVPLVALASEKFREFKRKYEKLFRIALSVGDMDSSDRFLSEYDFIVCTAEKLDSLIRHESPWLRQVRTVIIDEIHLLNDVSRGPTLEILITVLKKVLPGLQIIGLSATIGNPEELAGWLGAALVQDDWRPVRLRKGVYLDGTIEFSD